MAETPGRRPRGLLLFAVLLLLLGGRFLVTSVGDLHRVVTGKVEQLQLDGRLDAQQEALLRGQVVLGNALARHRPVSLALHATARLGLGLLYLFAVAAIFSNDARSRRVGLWAGWAGLLVCGVNALFLTLVVRRMLPWLEPMLADALSRDAVKLGRSLPDALNLAAQARLFLVDAPLLVTGLGLLWSAILIAYFRGRRVRLFYNGQRRQADHD
jgi:hypothetical protein